MNRPAALVLVLESCVLNDPDHRSLGPCDPGEKVVIAGGWYVESVEEMRLVQRLGTDAPAYILEEQARLDALEASLLPQAPVTPESFQNPSGSPAHPIADSDEADADAEVEDEPDPEPVPGPSITTTTLGAQGLPADGIAKSRGRRATAKLNDQ